MRVCPFEAVCVHCMCVCALFDRPPLLHSEPSLSSMFLSGERGNDTFVALNKRRGSSHAVSTGSGSGEEGEGEEGWEDGGYCGGEGGGGGDRAHSLICTASADLIISN